MHAEGARHEHVLYRWVDTLLGTLAERGVRHVVACPGSRSTPVAMMLAGRADIRLWMHLDERSAAFFALGLARGLSEPVGVLCTSGTAAANVLPAVAEAFLTRVPLVVLTADRPPELRDVGAPQTMDQTRLYGSHVKWFVDVPVPECSPDALRHLGVVAARSVATALAAPPGPVHLNLPFREPLIPVSPTAGPGSTSGAAGDDDRPADEAAARQHAGERRNTRLSVLAGAPTPPPALTRDLAAALAGVERGLIVCGPDDTPGLGDAVTLLASVLGWPILADALSGVRAGRHDRTGVLDAYDAYLRDPAIAAALVPEVVLRFGAIPTSKPLTQYLERHRQARQIVVDAGHGWRDPSMVATDLLHVDPRQLCAGLAWALDLGGTPGGVVGTGDADADGASELVCRVPGARVVPEPAVAPDMGAPRRTPEDGPLADRGAAGVDRPGDVRPAAGRARDGWRQSWIEIDRRARAAIAEHLDGVDEPFEGKIFSELAALLPDGAALVAGNSMPVRDLDTFFPTTDRRIRFLSNRGANGIDGVVSTALGVAASGATPLALVIGDVSFYHDLNGLLAARQHGLDATIILVNNDGGGIFSFLPQAAHPKHFEHLFGTPHGLDFRPVVEMYGGLFDRAETWDGFRTLVARSFERGGLNVVEMVTDRARNVAQHRAIWPKVSAVAADVLVGAASDPGVAATSTPVGNGL